MANHHQKRGSSWAPWLRAIADGYNAGMRDDPWPANAPAPELKSDINAELLESGKALLSFLDAYPHQWGVDIAGPQQALRAAIAKAEGRS